MRPCFVTTSFAPSQKNSGISNALFLLTKYLDEKKGISSTIFAPVQKWGTNDENLGNLHIRRFPISDFLNFSYSRELAGKLRKEHQKSNFDIVHSFHFGFYPATIGFDFSKKSGLRHFLTAAYHPPASRFKRFLMSAYNHINGKSILGESTVFPFNNNEKNQLSEYSKIKYKIIPCPVNDEIFYPRSSKFSRTTVAYLGTFLPWKGPQIALDIFKKISQGRKDVDFIIMGTGPLEHHLRENSGGNIKVLSGMTAGKVAETLSKSDIVVSPTMYESFGSAIAESMMCGTPVISTRVGAVPETVGPGGILVDYGQWDQMRAEIERLLDDTALRKKFSKNAIEQAENYKYKKVSEEIYRSYI